MILFTFFSVFETFSGNSKLVLLNGAYIISRFWRPFYTRLEAHSWLVEFSCCFCQFNRARWRQARSWGIMQQLWLYHVHLVYRETMGFAESKQELQLNAHRTCMWEAMRLCISGLVTGFLKGREGLLDCLWLSLWQPVLPAFAGSEGVSHYQRMQRHNPCKVAWHGLPAHRTQEAKITWGEAIW